MTNLLDLLLFRLLLRWEKFNGAPSQRRELCGCNFFFSVVLFGRRICYYVGEMEESLVRSTGGHVLYIAASAWKESKTLGRFSPQGVWIDHNRRPFSTARPTVSTHTHSTGTGYNFFFRHVQQQQRRRRRSGDTCDLVPTEIKIKKRISCWIKVTGNVWGAIGRGDLSSGVVKQQPTRKWRKPLW